MAIYPQDLDDDNVRDLMDSAAKTTFMGIVDEEQGGIIAYAHDDHAHRIITALTRTEPQRVCVLGITTKYGDDIYVHRTHDGAHRALVGFVDSWWEQEMDGAPRPASDADAVAQYFDKNGDYESYYIVDDSPINA